MSTSKKCCICPYHISHYNIDHENKRLIKFWTQDCEVVKCVICKSNNAELAYAYSDGSKCYCMNCCETLHPNGAARVKESQQEDYEKWKKSREAWEAENNPKE